MGGGGRGRRAGGGRGRATTIDFTDIFGDLFGGGRGGGFEAAPEPEMQAEVTIDFRDAVLGSTIGLQVSGDSIKVKIPEESATDRRSACLGRGRRSSSPSTCGRIRSSSAAATTFTSTCR
jgi:molecular chaperone DnaJ